MPALLAVAVIAPLLYIPGYLIERALLPSAPCPDILERHFQRVTLGVLLNGWLAFTLAEFGVFSAWFHLSLVVITCALAFIAARRRGGLPLRSVPLGIIAGGR
ncbi:MAG: hypothetical protein HC828_15150 [Blastochloris sp.]|nr:hypothetical protein [Blastochloris sp.]